MASRNKVAYAQGVQAAINGYERVSPYINCSAEQDWYAGFDSVSIT